MEPRTAHNLSAVSFLCRCLQYSLFIGPYCELRRRELLPMFLVASSTILGVKNLSCGLASDWVYLFESKKRNIPQISCDERTILKLYEGSTRAIDAVFGHNQRGK